MAICKELKYNFDGWREWQIGICGGMISHNRHLFFEKWYDGLHFDELGKRGSEVKI